MHSKYHVLIDDKQRLPTSPYMHGIVGGEWLDCKNSSSAGFAVNPLALAIGVVFGWDASYAFCIMPGRTLPRRYVFFTETEEGVWAEKLWLGENKNSFHNHGSCMRRWRFCSAVPFPR